MHGAGRLMAICALVAVVAAQLLLPTSALALEGPNDVSSIRLIEQPKKYDGTRVTFEGEAIGEAMVRGADAWIHLNDDAYMYKNVEEGAPLGGYNTGMPVWLPAELAQRIGTFGDYKHQGDVVKVTGIFNAACAQHGGDMDIHATALEIGARGRPAADPVKPGKVLAAAVLTLIAVGIWYSDRRLRHKERRGIARGK